MHSYIFVPFIPHILSCAQKRLKSVPTCDTACGLITLSKNLYVRKLNKSNQFFTTPNPDMNKTLLLVFLLAFSAIALQTNHHQTKPANTCGDPLQYQLNPKTKQC